MCSENAPSPLREAEPSKRRIPQASRARTKKKGKSTVAVYDEDHMDWSSADIVDVTDLASIPVQGSGMFTENEEIVGNGFIGRFEQCSVAFANSADVGHPTMDIAPLLQLPEQDPTSNGAGHMNVDADHMNVDIDDIIIHLESLTPEVEFAEAVETMGMPRTR
jgi:hypothetical protein